MEDPLATPCIWCGKTNHFMVGVRGACLACWDRACLLEKPEILAGLVKACLEVKRLEDKLKELQMGSEITTTFTCDCPGCDVTLTLPGSEGNTPPVGWALASVKIRQEGSHMTNNEKICDEIWCPSCIEDFRLWHAPDTTPPVPSTSGSTPTPTTTPDSTSSPSSSDGETGSSES